MKKIILITDSWTGISSGLVTALSETKKRLELRGFGVSVIHPALFFSVSMPNYPEIKLAFSRNKIEQLIRQENPDYIHIATEGPIGLAGRMACVKNKWRFTTAYHTRLPEYIEIRVKILKQTTYSYMRWFHSKSEHVMVSVESLKKELEAKRFKNLVLSPLGTDTDFFRRNPQAQMPGGCSAPIFTFVGRIAPEKNLRAFLECKLPGTKLIIGDGPQRQSLEEEFAGKALFVGYKKGQDLVDLLSISDVFVFPSKTDTFGLALVEALACNVPVAAYNVQGPSDIVTNGVDGFLGDNLEQNALNCLRLDRSECRKKALYFSWENSVTQFIKNLVPLYPEPAQRKNLTEQATQS